MITANGSVGGDTCGTYLNTAVQRVYEIVLSIMLTQVLIRETRKTLNLCHSRVPIRLIWTL